MTFKSSEKIQIYHNPGIISAPTNLVDKSIASLSGAGITKQTDGASKSCLLLSSS